MNSKLRTDIQGLRALAITLVILFHYQFSSFSAGFIGVDIFFLISGFLITASIDKNTLNNKIQILPYYHKRLLRLMPVYLAFLLITLIIGVFSFYTFLLENLYSSTIASLFGYSNFHYIDLGYQLGYFVFLTFKNPLAHTWSLAIEFQFYLLWPVFLLGLKKIKIPRLIQLTVLFIIFLSLSQYFTLVDKNNAYFLSLARVHEFLAGAIIWNLQKNNLVKPHTFFGIVGWTLLILCLFYLPKHIHYPGFNSILPLLAGSFILLDNQRSHFNKFLSLKPIQYLGNISYSLYLWHWMLFAYRRYYNNNDEVPTDEKFYLILISLALSSVTWKVIEEPFRRLNFYNTFPKKIAIPIITIITIALLFFVKSKNYNIVETKYNFEVLSHKVFGELGYKLNDQGTNDKNYIVMGDSISYGLIYGMRLNGSEANFIRFNSDYRCFNFGSGFRTNNNDFCNERFEQNLNKIKVQSSIDRVYLHDQWLKLDLEDLNKNLAQIRAVTSAPIYVFGPRMRYKTLVPKIIFLNREKDSINSIASRFQKKDIYDQNEKLIAYFNQNRYAKENITYIDFLSIQCDFMQECEVVTPHNEIIYLDARHFTTEGANYIGSKIKKYRPDLL